MFLCCPENSYLVSKGAGLSFDAFIFFSYCIVIEAVKNHNFQGIVAKIEVGVREVIFGELFEI